MTQSTIKPGAFIVFEGLDATGKSTQMNKLKLGAERGMFTNPAVLFTHQPSGGNSVGEAVYRITEEGNIQSPLARQFLHLASHAEHYQTEIAPALSAGTPVFMDRCWWSTLAYGWPHVKHMMNEWEFFYEIATLPTMECGPDVVFLFKEPHMEDRHNTPEVLAEYERLQDLYAEICFVIPKADEDQTLYNILMILADLGLAS